MCYPQMRVFPVLEITDFHVNLHHYFIDYSKRGNRGSYPEPCVLANLHKVYASQIISAINLILQSTLSTGILFLFEFSRLQYFSHTIVVPSPYLRHVSKIDILLFSLLSMKNWNIAAFRRSCLKWSSGRHCEGDSPKQSIEDY